MHVIALGHDAKILDRGSRAFSRQLSYAALLDSLTILIPTKTPRISINEHHLLAESVASRLSIVRFGKLLLKTAKTVAHKKKAGQVLVTVQSPFEFGIMGLIVSYWYAVPLEVQLHGDFYSSPYWRQESRANQIRYYLGLLVLRRATSIRAVSPRIAESLLARHIPAERIVVLPIEADLAQFLSASPQALWTPEPDALYVITVGRLAIEKNIPLLIRSFANVWRTDSRLRLIIVGEGPAEVSLKKLVATLWSESAPVHFYPWQASIAPVLKAADIYALTSDYEGYAMVLGEAMAAGLPIVTTDVGCVGTLVERDKHALVVSPRDETAFTAALSRIVSDKNMRVQFAQAAKKTIEGYTKGNQDYVERVVKEWQHSATRIQ